MAARRIIREVAVQLGFADNDVTRIVTAASELARNIFKYAGEGVMRWHSLEGDNRRGIEIEFQDRGLGIADIALAMREGYSTSGGLGMGLPGAKRLMDDLEIHRGSRHNRHPEKMAQDLSAST
ncbi:MAG: anti-sigma regulatory factor [Bryobacteraceae bacterium]